MKKDVSLHYQKINKMKNVKLEIEINLYDEDKTTRDEIMRLLYNLIDNNLLYYNYEIKIE